MMRAPVWMVVALAMWLGAACSGESTEPEAAPSAPAESPAAADAPETPAAARSERVPVLEGYKYYVGGPVMGEDEFGRFRLQNFQGEVEQPPSRGMVFGVLQEGDEFEYRIWGNGVLLAIQKGKMRDGLFWPAHVENHRGGKLIMRQQLTNDDEAKQTKIRIEDLDRETGEVIRTREGVQPYTPAPIPDDVFEDDEDEEADEPDAPEGAGETGTE